MKKLNVILVYNKKQDKILMCKREKEPYKGKFNLVGGKIEPNENELKAAYRELEEETGITKQNITLSHLMTFQYPLTNVELQVYTGKLNEEVKLIEEVNKLYWIDKNENCLYGYSRFCSTVSRKACKGRLRCLLCCHTA